MSMDPPTPKYIYSIEFEVEDPIIIPNGPNGTRAIFEFKKGHGKFHCNKIEGSNNGLEGTVIGPASDWACLRTDGSMSLDVHLVLQTSSGKTIYCHAIGRSQRDEQNPKNSFLSTAATYEAFDDEFKWLNNKVLIGKGIKEGSKFKVDYYDIV